MVCARMQFNDDEVPEWYCCGDIVCPFADEQLEDDEVHIAVDNTYLVIGWVAFNCVDSFFALPHNGSRKQWVVPPKDKNRVRLLLLPLGSAGLQRYKSDEKAGRITPATFYEDSYSDIKVVEATHKDEEKFSSNLGSIRPVP